MSSLPTCPCCGGILDVPAHYTLTSACRCGFPEKVDWSEFPPREAVPYDRMSIETDDESGTGRIAA